MALCSRETEESRRKKGFKDTFLKTKWCFINCLPAKVKQIFLEHQESLRWRCVWSPWSWIEHSFWGLQEVAPVVRVPCQAMTMKDKKAIQFWKNSLCLQNVSTKTEEKPHVAFWIHIKYTSEFGTGNKCKFKWDVRLVYRLTNCKHYAIPELGVSLAITVSLGFDSEMFVGVICRTGYLLNWFDSCQLLKRRDSTLFEGIYIHTHVDGPMSGTHWVCIHV